jgi:hypothetical protein
LGSNPIFLRFFSIFPCAREQASALVPGFITAIPGDVIDGKPLRYRLNPDGGFVLYSIGWNQTDDGGQLAWVKPNKDNAVDIAQGDWVWLMAKGTATLRPSSATEDGG